MKKALVYNYVIGLIALLVITVTYAEIADAPSVCTKVKMEIDQEMTLERQAFRAHMRISNGMPNTSITGITISVIIKNANGEDVPLSWDSGDNEDALFSIRQESAQNMTVLNNKGTIAPDTAADLDWLIIPTSAAANGKINGEIYSVGAVISYTINEEEPITIEVEPDTILVKPLPELTLDYFFPEDVLSDDAFTPEIEPAVPFSFGLRISNDGIAIASNVKINSAYPKIVQNDQQTIAAFEIIGSEVNGEKAAGNMLVNFGDIQPGHVGTARWNMNTAVSGKFTAFNAEYTHSDELGGSLTSLISDVRNHILIHDVLVDVNGRDNVRDFLVRDGSDCKLYESEGVDTVVSDQSALAAISLETHAGSERTYKVSVPPTDGFMYVKLTNPERDRVVKQVMRSDGKLLNVNNCWLSQSRNSEKNWEYFVSIFDSNTHYTYRLIFDEPKEIPLAPVIQFIPDRVRYEGESLTFTISSSDPNKTIPALYTSQLPVGAVFRDEKNGTGIFEWHALAGQAGTYIYTVEASDGVLKSSRQAKITILKFTDIDQDGIPDDWEIRYFGNLQRNGLGDFDNDGVSDIDEFFRRTDPALVANIPPMPEIVSPGNGAAVASLTPQIEIQNSIDPNGDTVHYDFELYSDEAMTSVVASVVNKPETPDTTTWQVPETLLENNWYYWRARATDGTGYSLWRYGSFFVNTANSPPLPLRLSGVANESTVNTLTPMLSMTYDEDPDLDPLNFKVTIYNDILKSSILATYEGVDDMEDNTLFFQVPDAALENNMDYFWNATISDNHGETVESALFKFSIDTAAIMPTVPVIIYPPSSWEILETAVDLKVAGDPELTYVFELDQSRSFTSPALVQSDEISGSDTEVSFNVDDLVDNTCYFWRVKAIGGGLHSTWVNGVFFVNKINDTPVKPILKNPGHNAWAGSMSPVLSVSESSDPDFDTVEYVFELYSDEALKNTVAKSLVEKPEWIVPSELHDNTRYYWRVAARDEHGKQSGWMTTASFFVRYSCKALTVNTVGYNQTAFPMVNQRVSLYTDSYSYLGAYRLTDANGNSQWVLPDGEYKLGTEYCGYYFWSDTFTPSEAAFVINHGLAEIHVLNSGTPVPNAVIAITTESGKQISVTGMTDTTGKAVIQLPTRNYTFSVEHSGKKVATKLLTIKKGQTVNANIDLGL